jgi:hypothetical protein
LKLSFHLGFDNLCELIDIPVPKLLGSIDRYALFLEGRQSINPNLLATGRRAKQKNAN